MTRPDPEGRHAEGMREIPRTGWKSILLRTKDSFVEKNLSVVAGGAAFFVLLALFPALAAIVSVYGLVFDPAAVQDQVASIRGVMPDAAAELLSGELDRIASTSTSSLGIAFAVGLLAALWSANRGVKGLISALNMAYGEREKRGFLGLLRVSFTFTFGAILILVLLLAGVSAAPGGLSMVGLEGAAANAFALLRWPILFAAVTGAIVLLYRYGPSRARPRWRWVSWGAVLTALAWILFSAVFSWFLANVANYSATYGTLGTAIAVMMWLYLSVVILLLGATLNAETERQLATDTTVGPVKPLGARGAIVADRLADGVPAR